VSLFNSNKPKYDAVRADFLESNGSQRYFELLEWIIWRLPELRPCIERSISLPSQSADWEVCWKLIGEACDCQTCSGMAVLFPEKGYCLKILTLTIVDYLSLLFRLSIDPLVLPSCKGLRLLYAHKARRMDNFLQTRPKNASSYVSYGI
jgi:hypothetical protein